MKYIASSQKEKYSVAILIKDIALDAQQIQKHYLDSLASFGLPEEEVIVFGLGSFSKANSKIVSSWWEEHVSVFKELGVQYLYVADANFFKLLTKVPKVEGSFGEFLPCKLEGGEDIQAIVGINYQAFIYNPDLQEKKELSLKLLASGFYNKPIKLGEGILQYENYPNSISSIQKTLESLKEKEALTCDIEAFSLNPYEACIGTIAFAWNQHEGVAFPVDYTPNGDVGECIPCIPVRELLKKFFEEYQGTLIWHNAAYDVKVKIATLWMKHLNDYEGMLHGLDVLTKKWHDTKIISYLALNSTADYSLKLKELAHEYAGNWAVEVSDIRKVALPDLLKYNLIDACCTWYVFNKYYPKMIEDQQERLYKELMMPSQKLITQLELIGLPINLEKVKEVKQELETKRNKALEVFKSEKIVAFTLLLQQEEMQKTNAKLKKKQHPLEHFSHIQYNPNSGPQTQKLLYEFLGLPVIDKTDKGFPSVGADTLEKLLSYTTNQEQKDILESLIAFAKVDKILGTFIPAFENAQQKGKEHWLLGNFNLGGTVSGRLSSSNPNLQNLPSGSVYGKLIKQCFSAPKGWIFAGADFSSLEDYISALTTKDPNKLDVYLKGFDGHCLRAAYYFKDELSHIDLNDPESVNSIKKTHPHLRQDSKAPTFALTYAGTWKTLVTNLGWSEAKAKAIEKSYHELYKVSDAYVQEKLSNACKDGYVTVAFGLRLRTPLLKQVVWNGPKTKIPNVAMAESRTAGNALGQSYGLLNNRAAVEFMEKVWKSPYRTKILPVALIHDAIYIVMEDNIDVVEFANKELIASMKWQELPEIQHNQVKLGAALDLFYPDWSNPITLPNDASQSEILQTIKQNL